MADYTANLNLEKPVGNENFRRQVLNENMDKIDAAMAARETTTGAQAKADAVQASLNSHLVDTAAHGLGSNIINTPTISFGMNRIQHTGPVAEWPGIEFTGKHYVNLLGKDGDCEDLSKWTAYQATPSLDTTNKVFGNNGIKITNTVNGVGNINITPVMSPTKYYLVSAYLKNGNAATGLYLACGPTGTGSGGAAEWSLYITATAGFTRVAVKVQPSDWGTYTQRYVAVNVQSTAVGQYGYVDGIMVNEISAADYALSDAELLAKYPYVESVGALTNPYFENRRYNLVRNGNGEEGIGYWKTGLLGAPTLSIVNGKFRVTYASTGIISQQIQVEPNTDYYLSGNAGANGDIRLYGVTGESIGTFGSGVKNTGNNTIVNVGMVVLAAGIADFDSIMLIKGTTAPAAYKSSDFKAFVPEGQFFDGDRIKIKDGQKSGELWWKHTAPLYGKDFDWKVYTDYTGFKSMVLSSIFKNNILAVASSIAIGVRYDGKILQKVTGISAGADAFTHSLTDLWISIADTDSGWGESINPNDDEVKAFMNGWKAVISNGTRYIGFVSMIDGSLPVGAINTLATGTNNSGQKVINVTAGDGNTKFAVNDYVAFQLSSGIWGWDVITAVAANTITVTNNLTASVLSGTKIFKADNPSLSIPLLNWCKANVAPGYDGYRLHYKLANPEPVIDINVPISGDLWSLVPGDNYVTVDSGIILGEVANPKSDGSYYYINSLAAVELSPLLNKAESITQIHRNLVPDMTWASAAGSENGKVKYATANANFDSNATYTVDYQILKTLHAQVFNSLTMKYAQDVFSAITAQGKALEQKQQKNSALDDLIDLSLYEECGSLTYSNSASWVVVGSSLRVEFTYIFKARKAVMPITVLKKLNIFKGNTSADVTNFFTITISTNRDSAKLILDTTDSTTITDIKANGVRVLSYITADCRGRV